MAALQVAASERRSVPLVQAERREISRRSCTDLPCCVLFLGCLALVAVAASLGFRYGNSEALDRFVSGRDYEGRACGQDQGVEGYKLAYFTLAEGHAAVSGVRWTGSARSELKIVCTSKCPQGAPGDTTKPTAARERGLCPDDAYGPGRGNITLPGNCTWYGGNTTRFARYCIDLEVFDPDVQWGQFAEDIRASWPVLAAAPAVALVLGFLFLGFVHRCGASCFWATLLITTLVPLGAGIAIYQQADSRGGASMPGLSKVSPSNLKLAAYTLWALSGAMLLIMCCFVSAIKNVVAVMRATSQFLKDVPSQMLQPVLVGVAQFVVFVGWLVIFVGVASIGAEEGDMKKCLELGDVYCLEWSTNTHVGGLIFLSFMLYWSLNFLHALSHFGTSSAVVAWYFTPVDVLTGRKLPAGGGHAFCDCRLTVRSFCRGLVCHPGSLAFGAFAISLAQCGRLLMWWASKDSESNPQNPLARCVRQCVNCIADCFARFIEFVSEHAYAEVALRGEGFCSSAKASAAAACLKPALFALVGRVALAVRLLGVLSVVAGTTYATGLLLAIWPPPGLHSAAMPLAFAAVVAFVVGEVMLHPFSAAARASLHCLVLDESRSCDMGLPAPEHAPPGLLRLAEERER